MTPADTRLAVACNRALVSGARSQGGWSRQQIRAAARVFVRRHRRDAGYLTWVLHSVGTSSALAVALLGLSAPARAELPTFELLISAVDPLSGKDVGTRSAPTLVDLDGDGDLDVVAGAASGFKYFENTGDATAAFYIERTGTANPLAAHASANDIPAFGDLDADGDSDLLVFDGSLHYLKNTGDATAPAFLEQTGAANPLNGQPVGTGPIPALGDLDADGDLDLLVGQADGSFRYFENTGDPTNAAFLQRTGAANPLDGQDAGDDSAPALGDADADGDLDLVAGNLAGTLFMFENTGTATTAAFVARTGAANPLNGQDVGASSLPAFGDQNRDGVPELVVGELDGVFDTFANYGHAFAPRTGTANPLNGQSDTRAVPALGDLDNDGDLDVLVGNSAGFSYFQNTGNPSVPAFVRRTGSQNPLGSFSGTLLAPTLGDVDGDGDLDLIAGALDGTLSYYENTGSAATPAFVRRTGAANPLNGQDVGDYSAPALGDLDGDGDLDLAIGAKSPTLLRYYRNTGTPTAPAFVQQTGVNNPIAAASAPLSFLYPTFGDVDGDGDLDLQVDIYTFQNEGSPASPSFSGAAHVVVGVLTPALGDLDDDGDVDLVGADQFGNFLYFENFVVQTDLTATERTGAANPLNGFDVGIFATGSLGDLDRDGDLDFLAGERYGGFLYYENTGSALLAKYVARTGVQNPMNGQNVGARSKPAFGDLDGDGDLDVVAGWTAGFFYYENTGTVTAPAFAVRTGGANPLDAQGGNQTVCSPVLADLDRDGDLDLIVGDFSSLFFYYENTGSAVSPAFVERTGTANPFYGFAGAIYSAPAVGDVDGDGDLDVISGDAYGTFSYFENVTYATAPSFIARTGSLNPMSAFDVGANSNPSLGDLDGDGDLDLVTGRQVGTFAVHYFPEPARGWLLAAGIALLSRLRRVRRGPVASRHHRAR
jgi:hypothetical protein